MVVTGREVDGALEKALLPSRVLVLRLVCPEGFRRAQELGHRVGDTLDLVQLAAHWVYVANMDHCAINRGGLEASKDSPIKERDRND